ncbi:MAG: hypothetical protein KF775_07370 [Cyclobacteriaceae bacterium]|nr:hypothetical protein [Cyclobacteriaceae bacterium]
MKKNIIIGFLVMATVLSLIFGFSQKRRADTNEAMVNEYQKIAHEMKQKAEEQAKIAEQQMKIAEYQKERAEMKALEIEAMRRKK